MTLAACQDGPSVDDAVAVTMVRRLPAVSGRVTLNDTGALGLVRSGTTTVATFEIVDGVLVSSIASIAK